VNPKLRINCEETTNKEFCKETFFKDLTFFVDVVNNKNNETKNYKELIESYGGEVNYIISII